MRKLKIQQTGTKTKVMHFCYIPKAIMMLFGWRKGQELYCQVDERNKCIILSEVNKD